ncbi:MAG TPA: efflux RND transporter periplasmic adaptor subunit [Planctomycetota bacterium]|nr:efflux RND transporter periplasmic adaptor subunit [Planctomycetota bacterium]
MRIIKFLLKWYFILPIALVVSGATVYFFVPSERVHAAANSIQSDVRRLISREQRQAPPSKPVVSVIEIKPEKLQTAARFSAIVKPRRTVELSFKVPGTVEALHQIDISSGTRNVQEGDRLTQDIIIAQLETRDYRLAVATEAAALEQARATVRLAEAGLGAVEALLKAREHDFAFAKLDADRFASMTPEATSQRSIDLAASQRDVSAANVKAAAQQVVAAQQALSAAQQHEHAAQVSLDTSNDRLKDCFLKVPFSNATVVAKKVEAGERVAAYQSVFTVMDVAQVHVEFQVPDLLLGDEANRTFAPKVAVGDKLDVLVEALGWEKFTGDVTKIAPAADSTTRTFLVEVTLNNPPNASHPHGRLRSGMIASLRIGTEREAMLLPLTALQPGADAHHFCVYRLENGKAVRRQVLLGGVYGNSVEILPGSDVKAGDRIVVNGANRLNGEPDVTVLE